MPNKMLIDASHPEETRVVVIRGNRVEEFDFESQDKKQLKGNIYLARVTRVEPSLQACFVEYGGNRHGFLAFSEIHPDYYQIPVADRQALLKAEMEANRSEDDEENGSKSSSSGRKRRRNSNKKDAAVSEDESANGSSVAASANGDVVSEEVNSDEVVSEVDTVGAGDVLDEVHSRPRPPLRRQYKIQEVIKRRQIMLVQVVKEERGNKGAALTTYLSLAGRYSVLMPNTARGGGISRKITNPQDRKRLKEIVKSLNVPEGMGVILRTAGENRTKPEIKRDFDYLMRLWESVRTLTLKSIAPALVYEEGSLIKRAVRDLYNKEIDQLLVAGEDAYREAKDFMRMLMPSHAKVVQPYRDPQPLFARYGVEQQLDKIMQPQVTLKSGGYIIINQTEALVSIDVNSGRSTKEHSIEDTALQTNLEAAEEIARQLRLRDLAGLIVIDFIDMEEPRNNRAVEKRLKECLKNDRARIQVGRISHFGLLEMSRQRIRASVLESTMQPCPHCHGTGQIRSDSSLALLVMRAIEDYLLKNNRNNIIVRTPASTALYLLNQKRQSLIALEERFGVSITVETDNNLGHQHYAIVKGEASARPVSTAIQPNQIQDLEELPDETVDAEEAIAAEVETTAETQSQPAATNGEEGTGNGSGRKRRRKRHRRGRGRNNGQAAEAQAGEIQAEGESSAEGDAVAGEDIPAPAEAAEVETVSAEPAEVGETAETAVETGAESTDEAAPVSADAEAAAKPERKRVRGKRGGRRNRAATAAAETQDASSESAVEDETVSSKAAPDTVESEAAAIEPADQPAEPVAAELPVAEEAPAVTQEAALEQAASAEEQPKAKTRRRPRARKAAAADVEQVVQVSDTEAAPAAAPTAPAVEATGSKVEEAQPAAEEAPAASTAAEEAKEEPQETKATEAKRTRRRRTAAPEAPSEPVIISSEPLEQTPRKTGWWQRKGFF